MGRQKSTGLLLSLTPNPSNGIRNSTDKERFDLQLRYKKKNQNMYTGILIHQDKQETVTQVCVCERERDQYRMQSNPSLDAASLLFHLLPKFRETGETK